MFGFLKKNKEKEAPVLKEDDDLLVKGKSRYVCTLNKYLAQECELHFKKDGLVCKFEEGDELVIMYDQISDCGKINNTQADMKRAMDNKILSQNVMSSQGFLAGGFYTLTNDAKVFLYIKFKDELNVNIVHTFLVEFNDGVEKALKIMNRR